MSRNAAVALLIRREVPDPDFRSYLLDVLGLVDGDRIAPDDLRTITFSSLNGALGKPSMLDARDRAERSTAPPALRVLPPIETPAKVRKPRTAAQRKGPPQEANRAKMKPCGTEAAARRHVANREPLCEPCRLGREERKVPRVYAKSPCGTKSAYQTHMRRGEHIDDACREAYNTAHRESRARLRREREALPGPEREKRVARRRPRPACGTEAGYKAHRSREEAACKPCLEASAAAARERRRVKAAAEGRTVGSYGAAQCGTDSGRTMHRRRGEIPCRACKDASNAAQANRRKSRAKVAA